MSKARELSKLLSGTIKVGALQAPAGTTAQRPSGQVGQIRYNSETGKNETYDSGGWGAIATPPLITTVSPSTYNGEAGTQFTINGSFFDVGANVKFIDNAGIEYTAATVTRNNAGQLLATTSQDFTVAQEPLKVKVLNPSGLNYTLESAIDCGGVPTWNTAAGNLATVVEDEAISSIVLSAGDPDAGATVSYLINSGALPTGLSLSAGGIITGTPNVNDAYSTGVTHNFDVAARDNAGNQTLRSFNIIRKWRDGSSAALAATSASVIKALTGTSSNGLYYINLPTIGVIQVYCDMSTNGGGWMHAATFSDNNEARGSALNTSQQSGGNHPWAAPLYAANDTGIWQNLTTLGSQSFTSDFKSAVWSYFPMTQMLMKDSGDSLRNLWYTNASQISSQTLSAFWAARAWGATGSEDASSAISAGRVFNLSITTFGIADPVFDSSNNNKILFKFGEYDGAQDGNKDRSMISIPIASGGDVDIPHGIGCFTSHDTTQGGPSQYWRDIVPFGQAGDEPPNTISDAPYNYTFWVK